MQLHYYGQTNLLEVAPGKTILEVALQDRVPLRYSCKSGTCGVCSAILLSGRVTMAANHTLTQQEVDAGKVLLCQTHPLDNEVTVEII